MSEPKKRGRPSNAEKAAKLATFPSAVAQGVRLDPNEPVQCYRDPFDVKLSQAYAERVWSKQSRDLSRHERLGRVREALEAQGLSMEGVTL